MSQKPQVPVVTDLTLKAVHNLKNIAPPLFADFYKALQKYQQAQQELAKQGAVIADTLLKIGGSHPGDLGEGIRKIADFIKEFEGRRDESSKFILTDILGPLKLSGESDIKEVLAFEKNYKRDREQSRADIMKLEARTKKAGKKTSPEALKQQIGELNDKVKEAENMKTAKFRDAVVLERKKYATLLALLNSVLSKEADIENDYATKQKANDPGLAALAGSITQLPKEYEELIQKQRLTQERTFVQIQQMPDQENYRISYAPNSLNTSSSNLQQYNYDYGNYDSYDSYDTTSYDSGAAYNYDNGYSYDGNSSGGVEAVGGHSARALYDYVGDQSTDLTLTAGEIITVIQDDDGSGWTKGQNSHGNVGLFPTSYIQYL